jgi:glycosyltransferase involved in cell wall biosynthesis
MSVHPTITAAIIALDAERNLAELLPMLDWTDEVVVVDGGSRDATVQTARLHGCRVAQRRFDTFARQRNYALHLAGGDWVFSIDADERPTAQLAAEIRRRIVRPRVSAFRVPIRSTILGRRLRSSGTQDDRPVRLFRRRAARWAGDVHEVLRVRGPVGRLESWLTHRTHPNLKSFLAKMHCYTSLEAKARAAAGQCPDWRDLWIAPPWEFFRRLIWKQGLLDGPAGWAFCLLSGVSQWVLAREHRRICGKPVGRCAAAAVAPSPLPATSSRDKAPRTGNLATPLAPRPDHVVLQRAH